MENNIKIEWNPKIPIIIGLIETLYRVCHGGGCCHIVTDDYNIEDYHLQWVIDYCNKSESNDCIDKELSSLICQLLLQLSIGQRRYLFFLYDNNYIKNIGPENFDQSSWYGIIESEKITNEEFMD